MVPTEKEVIRINKSRKEITNTISYRFQFIDSATFMASSLSSIFNNLAEGIHRIQCKYGRDTKRCETRGVK